MTKTITLPSKNGEPVWELAEMFPYQGAWSIEEYLRLETNKLIEFTEGSLEVLPMPSLSHQYIVRYLFNLLFLYVSQNSLGEVLFSPIRIRVSENKFREPDLVFLSAENATQSQDQFLEKVDLVMEVVSPDDPNRDIVTKRVEYARAGISEYWIVNPIDETITVLNLDIGEYTETYVVSRGEKAQSDLLVGFEVDVSAVFNSPK